MKGVVKKKPELEHLQHSQPIHVVKNEKVFSGENSKGGQSLNKEIWGVTHGSNQPCQQKIGIEMEFYQQKHCQFAITGREIG